MHRKSQNSPRQEQCERKNMLRIARLKVASSANDNDDDFSINHNKPTIICSNRTGNKRLSSSNTKGCLWIPFMSLSHFLLTPRSFKCCAQSVLCVVEEAETKKRKMSKQNYFFLSHNLLLLSSPPRFTLRKFQKEL